MPSMRVNFPKSGDWRQTLDSSKTFVVKNVFSFSALGRLAFWVYGNGLLDSEVSLVMKCRRSAVCIENVLRKSASFASVTERFGH